MLQGDRGRGAGRWGAGGVGGAGRPSTWGADLEAMMMSRMIMTMIVVMQGGKPDLEGGRSSLPDLVEVGDQKMAMVGLEVLLLVHQHHEPRRTPSKGQEGDFRLLS